MARCAGRRRPRRGGASTRCCRPRTVPMRELPADVHRVDVRDAAALAPAARRRRRGLPSGGGGGRRGGRRRRAVLRQPQRLRHRGAAGGDVRGGLPAAGAGVVDGGLRAGPLRVRASTGRSTRCRGARADLDAGVFEHRCPLCGEPLQLAPGRRGRAAAAAQPVRGEQDRAGALRAGVGASRPAGRWSRCATTTSTAPACRATRPTPGWRRSSAPRSKRATCQGFSRTAGRCATSSTSTTSPRPTSAAVDAKLDGFTAFNVCSGRPISILEVATELCETRGDVLPLVTGQYRSGDVRHIVADPAHAAEVLGFRAAVDPRRRVA